MKLVPDKISVRAHGGIVETKKNAIAKSVLQKNTTLMGTDIQKRS